MSETRMITWDANQATAHVAYRTNEVIAIYPITPASPMGEHADAWSARNHPNLWGDVPQVVEMQSEGGAAGAVHGALQAGALTTTFTASQGLLLMIPNLYKIAGELTSGVIHVAARTIATHALSIFGDHSDVMAARQTGMAMLASGSVQEAHDFALIAQAATLEARVPFIHFFDGFRTSHEVSKTVMLSDEQMRAMIDLDLVEAHRQRALNPERPFIRGTAQNPDVFFQSREAINPFYDRAPDVVQKTMDRFAELTGRRYRLFDYVGHPEAETVLVLMGSGAETAHETVDWLVGQGRKVGVIKVRLYRPFSLEHLVAALPATARNVVVLDRTKEPGAGGEPLYLDVLAALTEAHGAGRLDRMPRVLGGRYGLSSKEFTPAMIRGVFDNAEAEAPKNHFTVGIIDDVTHRSLDWDEDLDIEPPDVKRAIFYGLGSDGTVGANKNTIKIIGEETDFHAQGYFVYDSKKSGAITVSHLRFGPRPIRSAYLVRRAQFVACHQWVFLEKIDVLEAAEEGGTFLLNSIYGPDEVWDHLPREVQEGILRKKLRFYVIDAYRVARDAGMGGRINTIMQTCYFAISGVLPREQAIAQIKQAIRKTYGAKGEDLVEMNFKAVDSALAHLHEVAVPDRITASWTRPPVVSDEAPDFVQKVTATIMARQGDRLPVSAFPPDGTWPAGTTRWEKRSIAQEIPIWDPDLCIQCNKCALVCPHAAIRVKTYDEAELAEAPEGWQHMPGKADLKGLAFTVQVSPDDCTGCTQCARVCPAKDKSNPRHKALDMAPLVDHRERENTNWAFFEKLAWKTPEKLRTNAKHSQLREPLFEFSGACAGCGETPYIKLLTQLFGDRLLIANATGCSSIYGGNLPTTPYTVNADGRGPAWSNSLFEDNAEFGFGFRLAVDQVTATARRLLRELAGELGGSLVGAILDAPQETDADIAAQRERVALLVKRLGGIDRPEAGQLARIADYLVRKSVWLVGGDGWAYDIGYGGLDHVLASDRDINILVMDTQVYSNTGGQASKATPRAAVAKFAAAGKPVSKKDLGMLAMAYGTAYVAQVAFGAKDTHTVQALAEAEAHRGPSLIVAYSHCIAHGYDLAHGIEQQKRAVDSGFWPLYRFRPGATPQLQLDSRPPRIPLRDFAYQEARFGMLRRADKDRADKLLALAEEDVARRFEMYQYLARHGADENK